MDKILQYQIRAEGDYLSRHSIALVLRDPAGRPGIGSSTCVKIVSHYLLATAAHNIKDVDDASIDLRAASELSRSRLSFVARSCSPSRLAPPTDIAWIELDERTALQNRLQFIELRDLQVAPGQTREHPFIIQGYPWASVQGDLEHGSQLDLESTMALTMAAQAEQLPRPLKEHEFAVEYPPRDEQDTPMEAPEPHGVSGGGVWRQSRHDEQLVWSPERTWLVGINTGWFRQSRVLYCTRIEAWLELVATDFPDTVEVVSGFLERKPW
jgi:hypothetical protein